MELKRNPGPAWDGTREAWRPSELPVA